MTDFNALPTDFSSSKQAPPQICIIHLQCIVLILSPELFFKHLPTEEHQAYLGKISINQVHYLEKRQASTGVYASTEVLYDLATALTNSSQIVNEFSEASTEENLLNITLNGSSPDSDFLNETIATINEG